MEVISKRVRLFKMKGFFPKVAEEEGWLSVYPNHHTNWKSHPELRPGVTFSDLSPMSLGPVKHNQPGLPVCLNLENLHQGNKRYAYESDLEFSQTRIQMYQDAKPHRHKPKRKGQKPIHSEWILPDGKTVKLSYIESRQIYCVWYERLALQTQQFWDLFHLIEKFHIRICGPDANPIETTIEQAYLDPSVPFGHERVLYTMLTTLPESYPWRKNQTLIL